MPSEDADASFSALVLTLATTAAVHFGDVLDPATGQKGTTNLRAAAQIIDMLALLEQKTRGNLSEDEDHLLEQVLYELRLRFVQAKQAADQKSSGETIKGEG